MKNFKDIITRSLMSAPIGVTIGLAIAIIYSLASHSEHVQPSTEQFIRQFATPVQAFLASMFLWALIGMLYGGSSVCFVQERWSITRQTVTHFFITYISYTLLAIIAGWMPLSLKFLPDFTITYCFIYLITWTVSMILARKTVAQMNKKIRK